MILAFILWLIIGCFIIILGLYAFLSKKEAPYRFWANAEMFPVSNIKQYNRAVGKLICIFGIVFIILGAPLLKGQNNPYIMLSVIGLMIETIVTMIIYVLVIEKKYRKK